MRLTPPDVPPSVGSGVRRREAGGWWWFRGGSGKVREIAKERKGREERGCPGGSAPQVNETELRGVGGAGEEVRWVMGGTSAARAEPIVALPNIKKIPVQGLAVLRTELREGGLEGTGEEVFFGVDRGRGRFGGVYRGGDSGSPTGLLRCGWRRGCFRRSWGGDTIGEVVGYGGGESCLQGGPNGSGS